MANSQAKWQIGKATDAGIKRRERPNEDAIGVHQSWFESRPPLIIVADGMGGYKGGALASRIVVETFQRNYKKMPTGLTITDLLNRLVQSAHAELNKAASQDETLVKMGSTVVAALLGPDRLGLVNVGDSRAYIFHDKILRQISTDQSRQAELQRSGLSPEAARDPAERNYLTMSISPQRREVQAMFSEVPVAEGDTVLLCTDGVWNTLGLAEMEAILADLEPQPAADKLIHMANLSQAADNISVIVARLGNRRA